MEIIDRYIYAVGKYLPRKNRDDIQVEMRSALLDTLEDRFGSSPSENEVILVLKEYGAPKKVAASYYPEGQYLIGPALYPLFRLILTITIAGVVGAQLLAVAVLYFVSQQPAQIVETFLGILNSIPAAVGMVVIVFAFLQWAEVRPQLEEDDFDPSDLPVIEINEPVKRGERIFGVTFAVVLLAILTLFPEKIGFVAYPGGRFFANPVIGQYIPWIALSIILGIALDIVLLWRGQWQNSTRVAKIGTNLISSFILYLLLQGHTNWLAQKGVNGFFDALNNLEDVQLLGMQAFRMAFGIALVVTLIETAVMGYRIIRANVTSTEVKISAHNV